MPDPKMTPEAATAEIMNVVQDVLVAQSTNDLDGLGAAIARLEAIVAETGVEIPGITDQLLELQGQTETYSTGFANYDAAMWAGDLDRARTLLDQINEVQENPCEINEESPGFDLDEAMAEMFIDMGVDVPDTPDLFEDIANGLDGAIDAAIASGVDLNTPCGPSMHTALLAALDAPGRRVEQIQKLVAAGSDPLMPHATGDNTLSWAMGYHHPETVTAESETALFTYLTTLGIDIENRIEGMWTTLHRAIVQSTAVQVEVLLKAGADPSALLAPEYEPEFLAEATSLMLAAPKPQMVRLLLAHGADARQADGQGRRVLEFVAEQTAAARDRATEDDPWTVAHADALEETLGILQAHLAH